MKSAQFKEYFPSTIVAEQQSTPIHYTKMVYHKRKQPNLSLYCDNLSFNNTKQENNIVVTEL